MALYENEVKLKGYVGMNAETSITKNQTIRVIFSLATRSGYKDKQTDEWVNRTEWHRIVAFGRPAEYMKGLRKGDYVEIVGELRSTPRELEVIKDRKKSKITVHDWEVRPSIIKNLGGPESSRQENLEAEPTTEDGAA